MHVLCLSYWGSWKDHAGTTQRWDIHCWGGFWMLLDAFGVIFDFFVSLLLRSVAVVNGKLDVSLSFPVRLSALVLRPAFWWLSLSLSESFGVFWFLTPTSCRCLRAAVRGVWFSPQICQCLSPRCCLVLGGQGWGILASTVCVCCPNYSSLYVVSDLDVKYCGASFILHSLFSQGWTVLHVVFCACSDRDCYRASLADASQGEASAVRRRGLVPSKFCCGRWTWSWWKEFASGHAGQEGHKAPSTIAIKP